MKFVSELNLKNLLEAVNFNSDGLICAIAQDHNSKEILMVAWMNRKALSETLKTGQGIYFSRSRRKLWRKGESSGQTQQIIDIRIDCDKDALLLSVLQTGVACHTGRVSCFSWAPTATGTWEPVKSVKTDPETLYRGNQ